MPITALGSATVAVRSPPKHLMHWMATMQLWRDFEAALGPLLSGFAISAIYLAPVLILAIALVAQIFRRAG